MDTKNFQNRNSYQKRLLSKIKLAKVMIKYVWIRLLIDIVSLMACSEPRKLMAAILSDNEFQKQFISRNLMSIGKASATKKMNAKDGLI